MSGIYIILLSLFLVSISISFKFNSYYQYYKIKANSNINVIKQRSTLYTKVKADEIIERRNKKKYLK